MVAKAGDAPPSTAAAAFRAQQLERAAPAKPASPAPAASASSAPTSGWSAEAAAARRKTTAAAAVAAPSVGISDAEVNMLKGRMEELRLALAKAKMVPVNGSSVQSNSEGFMVCREQADTLAKLLMGKPPSGIIGALAPKDLLDLFKKALPEGYSVTVYGNRNVVSHVPGLEEMDTQHAWVEVKKGKDVVTLDMWANESFRGHAHLGYQQNTLDFFRSYRSTFPLLK